MRVMLTRAIGLGPKGHIIPEMPGNQARDFIQRGLAVEAPAEKPGLVERVAAAVLPRRKPK